MWPSINNYIWLHNRPQNKANALKRIVGKSFLFFFLQTTFSHIQVTELISFLIQPYSLDLSSCLIDGFFFLASATFIAQNLFTMMNMSHGFGYEKYTWKIYERNSTSKWLWEALNEWKWFRNQLFFLRSFSYLKDIKHLTTLSLSQLKYST